MKKHMTEDEFKALKPGDEVISGMIPYGPYTVKETSIDGYILLTHQTAMWHHYRHFFLKSEFPYLFSSEEFSDEI